MKECFKCGISGERAFLMEVISREGIVNVCRKCSFEENLPVIKKVKSVNFDVDSERRFSDRLREARKKVAERSKETTVRNFNELKRQDEELKKIVNKNYENSLNATSLQDVSKRDDLVRNFHWIIMRARRLKKLTQEQLAKQINEPEAAIRLAEKGIIPKNNSKLVRKLEMYLGIKISNNEPQNQNASSISSSSSFSLSDSLPQNTTQFQQDLQEEIDFNELKNMTISDLRKLAEQKSKSL